MLLLNLSDGGYGLKNLTHDLGVRYGRTRYFIDSTLFDEIADLSYPEVKNFLVKYVNGSEPIPYQEYFALAGVKFTPRNEKKEFSMGTNPALIPANAANPNGMVLIGQATRINDFGNALGYKRGDELIEINGVALTPRNYPQTRDSLLKNNERG